MFGSRVICRVAVVMLFGLAALLLLDVPASAQDLEPRAFSPAPVGMNFALLGYGYSHGNVLFDQSLPVEDAQGDVHQAFAAYVRTIDFFGMTSKLSGLIPYGWGEWDGTLAGEPKRRVASGLADPWIQYAVNFVGAPAMTLADLPKYREGTVIGTSVLAVIPVGQYDPSKLINLGSNRWAFRARLGASHRTGRLTLEAIGSVRLYTANDEPYQAEQLTQDPLWGLSLNGIYQFKRGFWAGVGIGLSRGGQASIDGVETDTYQKNGRFGAVLVYPLNARGSLKLTYINSARTERGADFDTISLAYQARWGGGL